MKAKTGLPRSTLYDLLNKTRREYSNLIDLPEAAALVAGKKGIKIEKYFSEDLRRGLVTRIQGGTLHPGPSMGRGAKREQGGPKELTFKFGGSAPERVPFISDEVARQAERMAELYPKLYLFENSARLLIKESMEDAYGDDWWDVKVSRSVQDKVNERKAKENESRWHSKRGEHEIFYTDMDDLKKIIDNNWDLFSPWLGQRFQMQSLFHEIELSRNIVAHHNPLSKADIDRLESNFKVWKRQLEEGSGSQVEPGQAQNLRD